MKRKSKLKLKFTSSSTPMQIPDVSPLVEAALKNAKYDKNKDYAYKAFCKKLDDVWKK